MVLLVADAVTLATLVLMQHGKGADVGAAFGSGSANTMFGSAGSATFLTRLTVWLAVGFFLIAFGLAYTAKEKATALDDLGIPQVPASAPADDGAAPTEASDAGGDGAPPEERLTPESESVDSDIPDV